MYHIEKDIPLAVYGTLRKGYANYTHHLRDNKFVGTFRTREKYRLVISDFPCVLPFNGLGYHIEVDLFMIDAATLEQIDYFEGYPFLYQRVRVLLDNDVPAWMYIRDIPDTKGYLEKFKDKDIS